MKKINAERMLPIRDEAYQQIRKAILRGDYQPGERLQEEQLAEELGISRTPVREALRKLEVENMVVHYPHRGTVVSDVSPDEIDDLYEIRILIEAFIAKRAARNATPEDVALLRTLLDAEEKAVAREDVQSCIDAYNNAILKIADCPHLADIGTRVREILSRMIISSHLSEHRRPLAQQEHRQIVDALEKNDSDLAQALTISHLTNASRVLREDCKPKDSKGTAK